MKTETADAAWDGKFVMENSITERYSKLPNSSFTQHSKLLCRQKSFEFVSPSFSFLQRKESWLGSKEESPTAVFF